MAEVERVGALPAETLTQLIERLEHLEHRARPNPLPGF
jgi:hypothetical protein